jgi:hypothetical protein
MFMELSGKALYNLLRSSRLENAAVSVEDWQIEDYRILSDQQLFDRLENLNIFLSLDSFLAYAKECDGPEELTELLFNNEESLKEREKAYLLFFEIWRRKLPDRQTLSIFCDELDRLIDLFDRQHDLEAAQLEEALEDLEKILDESVDAGLEPKDAFALIGQFCAHDLESFLYDYIAELIDQHQELVASEWIDGFYDYLQDVRWFDFLRVRLFTRVGGDEARDTLARLMESLQERPELDLALEVTMFLAHEGEPDVFKQAVLISLKLVQTEEDFQDILAIVADFHRCLDQEKEEKAIEALFVQRAHRLLDLPFNPSDRDKEILLGLLKQPPASN